MVEIATEHDEILPIPPCTSLYLPIPIHVHTREDLQARNVAMLHS